MDNLGNELQSGDKVKIIKEKRTSGLLGAIVTVEKSTTDFVEVTILGQNVRFDADEIELVEKCPKLDKVLYHGTDARFVTMPTKQREDYLNGCSKVINALYSKYNPYYVSYNDFKLTDLFREDQLDLIKELNTTMAELSLNVMGIEDYEYGDFYLTSNKFEACLYALNAFAGGEWGKHAYKLLHLTEQAKLYDWLKELPQTVCNEIKTFAESRPKPVVFELEDLRFDDLRSEQGERLEKYIKNGKLSGVSSFRYLKPVVLDISKAIPVDKKTCFK